MARLTGKAESDTSPHFVPILSTGKTVSSGAKCLRLEFSSDMYCIYTGYILYTLLHILQLVMTVSTHTRYEVRSTAYILGSWVG